MFTSVLHYEKAYVCESVLKCFYINVYSHGACGSNRFWQTVVVKFWQEFVILEKSFGYGHSIKYPPSLIFFCEQL